MNGRVSKSKALYKVGDTVVVDRYKVKHNVPNLVSLFKPADLEYYQDSIPPHNAVGLIVSMGEYIYGGYQIHWYGVDVNGVFYIVDEWGVSEANKIRNRVR